ncbi:MAG TPA: PAS domain S-box protein [Bryobacteraceae bacterium]|nr:PAS domain S-box protein [Bryobacteraceae bacterium]
MKCEIIGDMADGQPALRPEEPRHRVEFYGNDTRLLARNIGSYAANGLKDGEGVLGILTEEHVQAVTGELEALGIDAAAARKSGRLVLEDAQSTLNRFLVGVWPDEYQFMSTMLPLIERVRVASGGRACRVCHEVVGLLWQAGHVAAAVKLEQLWSKLVEAEGIGLLCGYPIDVLDENFEERAVEPIVQVHTKATFPVDNTERSGGERNGGIERATIPEPARRVVARVREQYRTERRFRALVEHSADGIALLDARGKIEYGNPAISKVLGYGTAEIYGRDVFELIHAEDVAGALEVWREASARPGCAMPVQVRMLHKNGEWRWIEGVISDMTADRDIGAVVFNHRDITERKTAEQMEEKFRESAKLESLGILAGGIAHDFNNLLTGILGGASMLVEGLPRESPLFAVAEMVMQASERASQLTRQMLAYSGRGNFVVEPVDLSLQVREIVALVKASAPKDVRFVLELGESGMNIESDRGQLQQLIMNLAINACEAIAREGTVTLRTRRVRLDRPRDSLLGEIPPGDFVSLEVEDTGAGIDEATQKRMFEPFFTTKFTGRGLGLSAVLGIVRSHGGGIEVESKPGEGTRFTIFFPLQAHRAPAANGNAAEPARAASGLVLVVDDEALVRTTAGAALRHRGFRVLSCANGREAVEQFRRRHAEISLVLLDMTMPGLSGAETLELLSAIDPSVPVLVSSGYGEEETRARFGPGIAGFLQKPYTAHGVVDAAIRFARR